MKKVKDSSASEAALLRKKAEALLKKKPSKTASQLSETEILKLIHELEVHQIELELQNEELVLAKEQAIEVASQKYSELYDFAPTGYFTLSKEGKIIELNLCGSQMLGKERLLLKNSRFGFFISNDTKPIFNLFLGKVFTSKAKETCEVTLLTNANLPAYIHLTGIVTENGEQCLLTVVDITERKRAEVLMAEIIEKNPMSIQILDKEGFTIQVNQAHTKLFGAVPPSDYSIFTDVQLIQQGMGEIFERMKNGEVVRFPDSYFNVHDSISELPDVPV